MQRLVIAATALLVGLGAVVVGGYLLVSSGTDRLARAVPADTALYGNAYLQPSSAQEQKLDALLGKLPGFADASALDQKINQLAERLLASSEIDYQADLRPWLGNEVAVAVSPGDSAADLQVLASPYRVLLLVAVKDPAAARDSLPHLWGTAATFTAHPYRDMDVMVGDAASYALLPDLLVIGESEAAVRAALDADANAAPSLADSADFQSAMRRVPADHLASAYVDMRAMLPAGSGDQGNGSSTAAFAVVAEADGLRAVGEAALEGAAPSPAASGPSSLTEWMPADTKVEATFFGVEQSFTALTEQLQADPSKAESVDALEQLRTVAAIGLGVNVDRDLLPLFDGEAAVAVSGSTDQPQAVLLLKPSDPDAAAASIGRMENALVAHGGTRTFEPGPIIVTVLEIPDVATLAYSLEDGVLVVGPDAGSVRAAIDAHRNGETLASSDRYQAAFTLAGGRGATEVWVDIGGLIDAAGETIGLDTEARDILNQIGVLAMSTTTHDGRVEFHAVLTVE